MSEQTTSKVPQIRFKGFEGKWEEMALGKVLRIENGFAFKSRCFCDDKTGVVVLTPGSVKIGGGFQDGKGHFYKSNDDIPIKYKFESGDIFITMTDLTPTAQALGYPAIVPDDGVTYLHNQRLGKLVDFDGDKDFLFQLLSTEKYHRNIVSTSSGTTVKHSSPPKVLGVENHFPIIAEQTKIGGYFRELDSLIGLHQRKHDKLVTLKKAMLQKMFPQPGATTPEIRFKGFSGDWVEKRLGDIGLFYRGISYNAKNVCKSGLLVLRSSNIQNSRLILNSDLQFIDLKCSEDITLRKGDIAICMSNGSKPLVGKSALCEIEPASPTTVGAFCSIFRSANSIAPYLLQTTTYSKYLNELLAGSSINNLKNSDLSELIFGVPTDDVEQKKIGTYFRTLDELISKHAIQLEKLQQTKSACLEKMFV